MQDEFEEKVAIVKTDVSQDEYKKSVQEIEKHFRLKTWKLSQVANPQNGEEFFKIVMRIPWDKPKEHIVSEEKLVLVASCKVSLLVHVYIH